APPAYSGQQPGAYGLISTITGRGGSSPATSGPRPPRRTSSSAPSLISRRTSLVTWGASCAPAGARRAGPGRPTTSIAAAASAAAQVVPSPLRIPGTIDNLVH